MLLTEAVSTLVAGFFGGIAQTTPYAGFPAYKRMNARAGYTLLVGLFIGLGGMLGYVSFIVELIPASVLGPILIFLALEVTSQPFTCCPKRYAPAIGLAMLPGLARLLTIYFSNASFISSEALHRAMTLDTGSGFPALLVVFALSNGFILTGMLWGACMSEMIDRNFGKASVYLLLCSGMSLFGIIHSPHVNGDMILPWRASGMDRSLCIQFALAYVITAAIIYILSRISTPEVDEKHPEVYMDA